MSPSIIGKVLLDRYRVDTFIASGGMASVYRAWDIKRNVSLAMKVLNADLAEDPAILEKFKREANALKDLSHPNILPFYGLFESEGIFFLLTLFIDGSNLKDIISKAPGKTLPVSEALIYLKATCAALGWAHSKRLVHCDIKPGNVMIDQGGNIFLADFGIARHADSSVTSAAGAGTPAYMSPEQILGEHVSKETDIYSLGVMFYEMVAGRKPFEGRDFNDSKSNATAAERLRDAHIKLIPPDPRKFNPNLPAALSEVILKALNKKPSERYSSTNDFFVAVCKAVGEDESAIPDRTKIPVDSHSGNHVVSQSTSSSNPKQTPSSETKNIPTKVNGKMVIIGGVFLVGIITLLALLIPPKQIPTSVEMTNAIGSELPTISEKKNTVIPIPSTETPTTIPTKTPVPSPTTTATATRIPFESMVNPMDNAEMVLIPAGKFWMGSYSGESYLFWGAESPRHEVYLDGYWIYRTEVTNAMYAHCVAEKACPKLAIA